MSTEFCAIGVSVFTAAALVAGWIWQASRISARSEANKEGVAAALEAASKAQDAATAAIHEVAVVRLEMTRDFASVSHLKEVEERLVKAIDRLILEIGDLRTALQGRMPNDRG